MKTCGHIAVSPQLCFLTDRLFVKGGITLLRMDIMLLTESHPDALIL